MLNNKILKSISVGIATMMVMNPMTALAEEISQSENLENNNTELENEAEAQSAEEAAAETAEAAEQTIDWATVSGGDAVTIILEGDDIFDGIKEGEALDGDGNDLSEQAKDAAEEFEDKGLESLEEAQISADEAEQSLLAADAAAEAAQGALDKADQMADLAENIADEADELVEEAKQDMQEKIQDIQNAETTEDAQNAYDSLTQIEQEAKEDFADKVEAFEQAKKDYEAALGSLEALESTYQASVDAAEDAAEDADTELVKAKELADQMEQAMLAAKAEVDNSAAGALEIIQQQENVKDNTSINWREEDKLFEAIMENYYLPEQQGIKGAEVKRVQGPDNNEYNYFTATYVDENGDTQVKYYNFKMEKGSKSQIVIFEKREVEIKVWDDLDGDGVVDGVAPDEYDNYAVADESGKATNDTLSVEEVEAGQEDGSILEVEGEVVIVGEVTDTDVLVEEGTQTTEDGEQDVSIDEESASESYAFDEDGNLVKTITADVTTITYTNASFDCTESFDTEEDRDAAAAAKEAELEAANDGKDAVVTNTEDTVIDYTATVTYIPTFTETVEIDKTYKNSKYNPFDTNSAQEAIENAKEDIIDDNDLHNPEFFDKGLAKDDFYLMGDVEFNDMQVKTTSGKRQETYRVTGTAKATYAKITTESLDFSTLQGILSVFGSGDFNELKSATQKWVVENGGIFLEAKWFDFNSKTATVKYISANKISTAVSSKTISEAEQSAIEQQIAQSNANDGLSGRTGAADSYIIRDTKVSEESRTVYSYSVDYLEKGDTNTSSMAVSKEIYGNAKKLLGQVIQNKNYLEKKWLLEESTDEGLKTFLGEAQNLVDKYERLVAESQKAQTAVVAAQEKVEMLQKQLEALERMNGNAEQLEDLKAQLEDAEAQLKDAEKKLSDLEELDKDAEKELSDVLDKLKELEDNGEGEGDNTGDAGEDNGAGEGEGDNTGDAGEDNGAGAGEGDNTDDEGNTNITTIEEDNVPLADGPQEADNTPAVVDAGDVVVIEDEEPALADVVEVEEEEPVVDDAEVEDEEPVVDDAEVEEEEPNVDEVVDIEEEETALADKVDIEDEEAALADGLGVAEKMSWWWLLIILVLGATGREMYKRHQQKKLATVEENVEE